MAHLSSSASSGYSTQSLSDLDDHSSKLTLNANKSTDNETRSSDHQRWVIEPLAIEN
jgi:hypothetical protein